MTRTVRSSLGLAAGLMLALSCLAAPSADAAGGTLRTRMDADIRSTDPAPTAMPTPTAWAGSTRNRAFGA